MKTVKFLLALTILLALASCGGSEGEIRDGEVSDVRVDPGAVRIGEIITVTVTFSGTEVTTSNINGDDQTANSHTDVVVLLPPGVDFVDGSSKYDEGFNDDFDPRGPNIVTLCDDGSRALTYEFAPSELSTTVSNRIRFEAKAFEPRGVVQFLAEADSSISTPCGAIPEDVDELTILP